MCLVRALCLLVACAAVGTKQGKGGLSFLQLYQGTAATTPSETGLITLKALDSDHSGMVSFEEVKQFAKAQGLDELETTQEFKELDTDGDGQLGAEEISRTLDDTQAAAAPAVVAPAVAPPVAAAASAVVTPAVAPPVVAAPPVAAAAKTPVPPAAKTPPVAAAAQSSPVAASPAASAHILANTSAANAAKSVADTSHPAPPAAAAANKSVTVVASPNVKIAAQSESKAFLSMKKINSLEVNETNELEEATGEAEQQASRIVAEQFARMAERVLKQQNEDQDRAVALEAYAKELRANATKLSTSVTSLAQEAARAAAAAEIKRSVVKIDEIEQQARAAEEHAAQLREEADKALQNALQAKDNMTNAVEDLAESAVANMSATLKALS